MNNTEKRIYNTVNAYLGYGRKSTTKKDIDEHFNDVITIFSKEELAETSFLVIKDNLYNFWGVENEIKLVEMPVNKKAQDEYNKRFGIKATE